MEIEFKRERERGKDEDIGRELAKEIGEKKQEASRRTRHKQQEKDTRHCGKCGRKGEIGPISEMFSPPLRTQQFFHTFARRKKQKVSLEIRKQLRLPLDHSSGSLEWL